MYTDISCLQLWAGRVVMYMDISQITEGAWQDFLWHLQKRFLVWKHFLCVLQMKEQEVQDIDQLLASPITSSHLRDFTTSHLDTNSRSPVVWHQILINNCLTPSPDLQLSDTMMPSPDLQLWHYDTKSWSATVWHYDTKSWSTTVWHYDTKSWSTTVTPSPDLQLSDSLTPSPDVQLSDTKSWSTTVWCSDTKSWSTAVWHQVLIYNCLLYTKSWPTKLSSSFDLQLSDTLTSNPDLQPCPWHWVLVYNCLLYTKSWPTELTSSLDPVSYTHLTLPTKIGV